MRANHQYPKFGFETSQIPTMELSTKIVHSWKSLTIPAKASSGFWMWLCLIFFIFGCCHFCWHDSNLVKPLLIRAFCPFFLFLVIFGTNITLLKNCQHLFIYLFILFLICDSIWILRLKNDTVKIKPSNV